MPMLMYFFDHRNKCIRNVGFFFSRIKDFKYIKPLILYFSICLISYKIIMAQYKESLKLLFNSWNKIHEICVKIVQEQTRRDAIKKM